MADKKSVKITWPEELKINGGMQNHPRNKGTIEPALHDCLIFLAILKAINSKHFFDSLTF